MKVPEFLPMLSYGSHSHPSKGACVMEYISILSGERFSDYPECSLSSITLFAQQVNDTLPNEDRHLLVPLIPRLVGTATGDNERDIELANYLSNWLYGDSFTVRADILRMSSERKVQALSDLLDEYDRITGRVTEPATKEVLPPERVLV